MVATSTSLICSVLHTLLGGISEAELISLTCSDLFCLFYTIRSLHRLFYFDSDWIPFYFLPDLFCSLQLDTSSIKNRRGAYSPWSKTESQVWDASKVCCHAPTAIMHIWIFDMDKKNRIWSDQKSCNQRVWWNLGGKFCFSLIQIEIQYQT